MQVKEYILSHHSMNLYTSATLLLSKHYSASYPTIMSVNCVIYYTREQRRVWYVWKEGGERGMWKRKGSGGWGEKRDWAWLGWDHSTSHGKQMRLPGPSVPRWLRGSTEAAPWELPLYNTHIQAHAASYYCYFFSFVSVMWDAVWHSVGGLSQQDACRSQTLYVCGCLLYPILVIIMSTPWRGKNANDLNSSNKPNRKFDDRYNHRWPKIQYNPLLLPRNNETLSSSFCRISKLHNYLQS